MKITTLTACKLLASAAACALLAGTLTVGRYVPG